MKWEYIGFYESNWAALIDEMNKHGEQGWELAALDSSERWWHAVMKREKRGPIPVMKPHPTVAAS